MEKIQKTEDYNFFKRIKGNRSINKAQVSKLVASFGLTPELATAVPIIINDKNEIIDGQHRFEAWKKLNLPIYFLKADNVGLKAVQTINSATKTWSPIDYARSFAELGQKEYATYLDFKKKYKLNHNILISFMGAVANSDMHGRDNTTQNFRLGKFNIPDERKAHTLCSRLVELQEFHKRGDTRAFAIAFRRMNESPKYDHKRMLEKLSKHSKLLKDSPYAEDYMRQFERIYNHGCALENRVKLF